MGSNGTSGRSDGGRIFDARLGIGRLAVGSALAIVFAVIGVGAVQVSSRSTVKPAAREAPSGGDVSKVRDVVFDVRTEEPAALPSHIAAVLDVANYRASPDGSMLAFTGPGIEDEYRQIYVAPIDAGSPRRITAGPIPISAPSWSPDGTQIVYEAIAPFGPSEILVVDIDAPLSSSTGVRVARGSDPLYRQVGASPSFGPDGRSILFTRARGDAGFDLWTAPVSGGAARVLIRDAAYGVFSPDGRTIAYQRMVPWNTVGSIWPRNGGIWLADADGSHPRPLRARGHLTFGTSPLSWKHIGPLWSPDGTRIVFVDPDDGNVYVAEVEQRDECCSMLGTASVIPVGAGGWPSWLDDDRLIIEDYGRPAPAFTLADVAGIWFAIERGHPIYLLIGNKGNYVLELTGGVGSELDESGTVEVLEDSLVFHANERARGCQNDVWDLRGVSLVKPGRMTTSDGICRGTLPGGRPTSWQLLDDRFAPARITGASAPLQSSDLIGTWVGGEAFYRYAPDGTFAYYWADPDWPYWGTFELAESGTWQLRNGRLTILYEIGRMCPDEDGVMGFLVPTHDDRAHRLEVADVELVAPGAMSFTIVRDDCFGSIGDGGLRSRLFPAPKPFDTVVALATQETSLGDRWRVAIYRDVMGERICIGEPGRGHLCGPRDDPVTGWIGSLAGPLTIVDQQVAPGFFGFERYGWGVFAPPVASVEFEERDHGWYPLDPIIVDLPSRYGETLKLFLADCTCSRLRLTGLGSSGRKVASMRW